MRTKRLALVGVFGLVAAAGVVLGPVPAASGQVCPTTGQRLHGGHRVGSSVGLHHRSGIGYRTHSRRTSGTRVHVSIGAGHIHHRPHRLHYPRRVYHRPYSSIHYGTTFGSRGTYVRYSAPLVVAAPPVYPAYYPSPQVETFGSQARATPAQAQPPAPPAVVRPEPVEARVSIAPEGRAARRGWDMLAEGEYHEARAQFRWLARQMDRAAVAEAGQALAAIGLEDHRAAGAAMARALRAGSAGDLLELDIEPALQSRLERFRDDALKRAEEARGTDDLLIAAGISVMLGEPDRVRELSARLVQEGRTGPPIRGLLSILEKMQ